MNSPASALAWEFWGRHRWGLAGVGVLVLGFALVCAVESLSAQTASVHSMWFMMGLAYVIGVFAYGFDGRLETAESGFPTRLFTLPVRTSVLVGLPMLQGMATAVLLWVTWDRFVLQPSGVATPAWWTPMLAAVVATSQAIVWQPFGLPWLRVALAIPILTAVVRAPALFDLVGYQLADPHVRNVVLGVFAATLVSGAFLVAWSGVARARHGKAADWLGVIRALRPARKSTWERPPFTSAQRAQTWYEWRRRGLGYLLTVTIAISAIVTCAFVFEETADGMVGYATTFLVLPLLIAGFWGLYAGGAGDSAKSMLELTAFAATRPASNGSLVAAKLRMAALAATITWTVVITLTVVWLRATGGFRDVSQLWDGGVARLGSARTAMLSASIVVGPVLVIWRLLVVNLWVGLMGRAWVANTLMFAMTLIGANGLLLLLWSRVEPDRFEMLLEILPWLAGGAVVLKFLSAGWMLRILHQRGEMPVETTRRLVVVWFLIAGTLFGLLAWICPASFAPTYGLALGVVLCLPMCRLALAPLALAWNRHR